MRAGLYTLMQINIGSHDIIREKDEAIDRLEKEEA